jgi:hypothetical protein
MTGAQRRMLQLGLIPVIALVLGGAVGTVSTIRGKLDYNYSTTLDKPFDGVTITANMEVEVSPSTDDKVHVALSGTYTDSEPAIDVRKTAAEKEVEIGAHCDGYNCRVALVVELPSSTRLSISASGASVGLMRLSGPLQITADDGSVNGVRLKSETVSVSTQSGSVDLGFDRPPTNVEATTSNGSLQLLVPGTAAYAIDAAAVHGSTELKVNNDLSAPNQLHLRTTNGSITVDSN